MFSAKVLAVLRPMRSRLSWQGPAAAAGRVHPLGRAAAAAGFFLSRFSFSRSAAAWRGWFRGFPSFAAFLPLRLRPVLAGAAALSAFSLSLFLLAVSLPAVDGSFLASFSLGFLLLSLVAFSLSLLLLAASFAAAVWLLFLSSLSGVLSFAASFAVLVGAVVGVW